MRARFAIVMLVACGKVPGGVTQSTSNGPARGDGGLTRAGPSGTLGSGSKGGATKNGGGSTSGGAAGGGAASSGASGSAASSGASGSAASSGGSGSASSSGDASSETPVDTRSVAVACAFNTALPATPCTSIGAACASANVSATSLCQAGPNGNVCSFDQCQSDADCAGGVCVCIGSADSAASALGNICVPAGCRTSADCAGFGCSPSGKIYGLQGYYCHTANDQCVNDTDCAPTSSLTPYCGFDSDAGAWACVYGNAK